MLCDHHSEDIRRGYGMAPYDSWWNSRGSWCVAALLPFAWNATNKTISGMYNVPSFTLARAVGGVGGWYWINVLKRPSTPLIVMASVRMYHGSDPLKLWLT